MYVVLARASIDQQDAKQHHARSIAARTRSLRDALTLNSGIRSKKGESDLASLVVGLVGNPLWGENFTR